jgi:hypothetical protein
MNAILRRTVRGATNDSATPSRIGLSLFASSFGEGFEAAFAVCVMLGALWLLVSGYA